MAFAFVEKELRNSPNSPLPVSQTTATGMAKEKGVNAEDIPLQAWTGPEVSRRLRFLDFKTVGT